MFRNIQILLIEDDEVEREALTRAFKKAQFTAILSCVPDGIEALKILRAPHNRLTPPYLILLDMHLPGMAGKEFLYILRQDAALKGNPVFVLSNSRNEQDMLAAYNAGIAGYILKDNTGESNQWLMALLEAYLRVTSPFNDYLAQEIANEKT